MKLLFIPIYLLLFLTITSAAQCWKQVATGDNHAAAVKQDGTLWAWGYNAFSQIGNRTTVNRASQSLTFSMLNYFE